MSQLATPTSRAIAGAALRRAPRIIRPAINRERAIGWVCNVVSSFWISMNAGQSATNYDLGMSATERCFRFRTHIACELGVFGKTVEKFRRDGQPSQWAVASPPLLMRS